jgi:hypothetical protein
MADNNQVIKREIQGKVYTFSGLYKAEDGVLEFVNKKEESQLDGLDDILKAEIVAVLYAEHLREFPPVKDED